MASAPSAPEILSLLRHLPSRLEEESVELLVEGNGWHLERILSTGQVTPEGEWYDQRQDEWVLVLQGAGRLAFDDGSERLLERGDSIHLPAGRRHRVVWTKPDETTVWLALFFDAKDRKSVLEKAPSP